MKKYANYYHDGKFNKELYYYKDTNNYLFSMGRYKTRIKEEDLPDFFVKLWQYPRYKYISLKGIKDIHYRPSFFTNHWRKDDLLYISYNNEIVIKDNGYAENYDVIISGSEIDRFIDLLSNYGYNKNKLKKIFYLMQRKDKWYKYWEKRNWNGNYSFTSEEIWKEIMGDSK